MSSDNNLQSNNLKSTVTIKKIESKSPPAEDLQTQNELVFQVQSCFHKFNFQVALALLEQYRSDSKNFIEPDCEMLLLLFQACFAAQDAYCFLYIAQAQKPRNQTSKFFPKAVLYNAIGILTSPNAIKSSSLLILVASVLDYLKLVQAKKVLTYYPCIDQWVNAFQLLIEEYGFQDEEKNLQFRSSGFAGSREKFQKFIQEGTVGVSIDQDDFFSLLAPRELYLHLFREACPIPFNEGKFSCAAGANQSDCFCCVRSLSVQMIQLSQKEIHLGAKENILDVVFQYRKLQQLTSTFFPSLIDLNFQRLQNSIAKYGFDLQKWIDEANAC